MKKILALGIILLFFTVAVAPSINTTVVTASQEDDFIEVTAQACGIKGFGDTTVKLTREQYNRLEEYLVDFYARLNQTTTRDEAVPILKEAVVELDTYGLLPRRMNVDAAQRLVTGGNHNARVIKFLENIYRRTTGQFAENENRNCLISGGTTRTSFEGPVAVFLDKWPFTFIGYLIWGWCFFIWSQINPIPILSRINIGYYDDEFEVGATYYYSDGWVNSNGVNGQKSFNGQMRGDLPIEGTTYMSGGITLRVLYPAVAGFTGMKISTTKDETTSYFGFALLVKITQI